MTYFITFLEGIVTFVSPCLLPMLPVYISYFAAGGERTGKKTFRNALGFVLGFSLSFVLMGALAGAIGSFFVRYQVLLNLVTGLVVIFFGLTHLGLFNLPFFRGLGRGPEKELGFFSALLFGADFSVGWTPCVGAFLGSALMLASREGSAFRGILLLLCYALGLGLPFLVSALLIDRLKGLFTLLKKHVRTVSLVSGSLLVLVGILMATGLYAKLIGILA